MIGFAADAPIQVTYNLGPVDRVPLGEGREYEVAGELIAVFRQRNGVLHAVQADCPHRGGHLADGIIGAGKVICPLHSLKFELAGGSAAGSECQALKTYQVAKNEYGEILLTWSGGNSLSESDRKDRPA
jgi:nitrite reductase (NADH) small subunit